MSAFDPNFNTLRCWKQEYIWACPGVHSDLVTTTSSIMILMWWYPKLRLKKTCLHPSLVPHFLTLKKVPQFLMKWLNVSVFWYAWAISFTMIWTKIKLESSYGLPRFFFVPNKLFLWDLKKMATSLSIKPRNEAMLAAKSGWTPGQAHIQKFPLIRSGHKKLLY